MKTKVKAKNGTIYRKYNKKMSYTCKCGGDFMFDGQGTSELPLGIGFVNGVFGVTKIIYTGWIGECMSCRKIVVAYTSKKVKHKPLSI